jgi:DNA-binding transcriptional LysR family regulator
MSSRLREELDQMRRVLSRLGRPNHNIVSWSAVAMLEGLGNDKVVRLVSRAEELACVELTQLRDSRLVLTSHGLRFRDWLEELRSFQQSQAERTEELHLAVSPGVDPGIVAQVIAAFTRTYDHIALRVGIQHEGIHEAVESKLFSLGVTWTDSEAKGSSERIEPAIPASVQIPRNHRLFGTEGPITADCFTATDFVFMPPGMGARFSGLLQRVQPTNRAEIGCQETLRRLVADGHGLAVQFSHPSLSPVESFTCLPTVGVEPIWLCLVVPRKGGAGDELATKFLIEAIRDAVRNAALPPLPTLVNELEETESLPEIPPLPEPQSA